MKYSSILSVLIVGTFIFITSCTKPEEMEIEETKKTEEAETYMTKHEGLAQSMKKASLVMRRLAKSVENNDWVEMDMWTQELKEGIGFNCVTLYMIENNDISMRFIVLSNQFNSAINKLILCSKTHDDENTSIEFNNLVKSCDACHDSFNKDAKTPLDFTKSEDE